MERYTDMTTEGSASTASTVDLADIADATDRVRQYEAGWRAVPLCPICMEPSLSVRPLLHATKPAADAGDLSRHAMCASCRRQWPDACPFCRLPLVPEAPPPPPPLPAALLRFHELHGLPRHDGPPAPRAATRERRNAITAAHLMYPHGPLADHPAPVLARVAAASTDAVAVAVGERRRRLSEKFTGFLRRRRSMPARLPDDMVRLSMHAGPLPSVRHTCDGCRGGCMECDPEGNLMELDEWWPSV